MFNHAIGWTGTRNTTVALQAESRIVSALENIPLDTIIVTGGCVGVDARVAKLAHSKGFHVHTILPANRSRVDPHWREHCTTFEEASTYRDRNARIVKRSRRIIAVPEHDEHDPRSRRSGTWQTVRIARNAHKPVRVL